MSDKHDEITEEEMKGATGGAKYSISAEKTANRGGFPSGVEGTDPGGTGNTDPVYGEELTDSKLGGVRGGTNTTPGGQVKNEDLRNNTNPRNLDPTTGGGGNTPDRGSLEGEVK